FRALHRMAARASSYRARIGGNLGHKRRRNLCLLEQNSTVPSAESAIWSPTSLNRHSHSDHRRCETENDCHLEETPARTQTDARRRPVLPCPARHHRRHLKSEKSRLELIRTESLRRCSKRLGPQSLEHCPKSERLLLRRLPF